MKRKTIDSYFSKQKSTPESNVENTHSSAPIETVVNATQEISTQVLDEEPSNTCRDKSTINSDTLFVYDPTLRKPINSYPLENKKKLERNL